MEITIGDFTSVSDVEKSRYQLLNKLKYCEMEFNQSRLYPTYQMLINIYRQLADIISRHNKIFNKEYTDALNEEEMADKQKLINDEIEKSFELMHWAFSHINKNLETGRAIYDFVDESINIESIGIDTRYNKEGYFVVPDNRGRMLKIIKYERNLYKILKTREVGNYEFNIILIPKNIVRNYIISDDILNQIIYYLDTELSFPFSQTILPVAKRKFLNFLESRLIS
jgi:hypothetical protein